MFQIAPRTKAQVPKPLTARVYKVMSVDWETVTLGGMWRCRIRWEPDH